MVEKKDKDKGWVDGGMKGNTQVWMDERKGGG